MTDNDLTTRIAEAIADFHGERSEYGIGRHLPTARIIAQRFDLVPRSGEPADVSVQPDWARRLPIQQQSVLPHPARGPDGMRKHHPAKDVIRAYRACVLHAASAARPLRVSEEGDSFMSAHHLRPETWGDTQRAFFEHVDEIPHHYLLHLLHGAEILAYHHPSQFIRRQWGTFYLAGCEDMHLPCETRETMDARLNDFGRSNGGRQ